MTENKIIYQAKLHWILFAWPVVLACVAMLIGIKISQLKEVALLFVVFALIWLGMTWINFHFSSFIIQKKQIIFRTGMMVRQTIDIPITKIESIDIRQSVLGSIFHYGS